MYIYIHTQIHTGRQRICVQTRTIIFARACFTTTSEMSALYVESCIYTYIHIYIYVYTLICVTRRIMQKYTNIYKYIHIYTIYVYAYTYMKSTHLYIHIYMCTP